MLIVKITKYKKVILKTQLRFKSERHNVFTEEINKIAVLLLLLLSCYCYFVIKIPNEWELQQIKFNHSSDINFQDLMNLYKKSTTEPYSFLVIDTTLPSDNSSHFRKKLLETI